MILHSIVPTPIMQQMFADQADLPLPKAQSVLSLSPTSMVEGVAQGGQFTINRVLSTNPDDYLRLSLGTSIPFDSSNSQEKQNYALYYPHLL